MSRLIVKNLPNSITSEKLKKSFSLMGVVTDIQLKYTRNGKFRHFGFVGFKTLEEAEKAVEYFNNTFINESKVIVEHCAELGDANKPKAWSKYAPDSSAYRKLHPEESKTIQKEDVSENKKKKEKVKSKKEMKIDPAIAEQLIKHKDDPMFLEFLEAHAKEGGALGSEAMRALTDDKDSGVDEANSENDDKETVEKESDDKKSVAFANISDLEYLKLKKKSTKQSTKTEAEEEEQKTEQDTKELKEKDLIQQSIEKAESKLFTVKVFNLPYTAKKKDLKDFFRSLKPAGIRMPRTKSGFAYVTFKTTKEMKKALNKNKSFLNGRQVGVKEYIGNSEHEVQQETVVKNEKQRRWKEQEEALLKEENIAESGSIFVRNLPYTISEEELTQHFSTFGPIADVNMPIDKESRKMKGFATITFVMPEHAVAAYTKLDGSVFHGRMLHLLPAKTKQSTELEDEETNFKDKKKAKQKASAGQSHNWNSLFLGQNAIVDVMAETYNISKKDVLTGPDVAVRLALGETQIVSDTKQFLLDNGVSLDAFNQAPKIRSKTVILAKNLPAKTTTSEIRELFVKFGELGRVLLPPSGVTAIIEFLEPSEAKKAFFSLAYTKFKHLPLYLEWAPDDTFTSTSGKKEKQGTQENKEENTVEEEKKLEEEIDEDLDPEPDTTLYVKNLNFDTTEESMKKHFSKCGRVANVTIARKKDPKRPGQLLSMGYGFVQYYRQSHVGEALKQLQHSDLEGHQLELKRSNRTLQESATVSRKKNNVEKQTGTKILVRNIPFQAKKKEVEQLFKTFGEIKDLRLPKKMVGSGSHRGFAFVEFCTKHDAKRAMHALCQSTHFFGRRLVLEWAQEDENVEELRKRTAQHFQKDTAPRSKKARADLDVKNDEDDEED